LQILELQQGKVTVAENSDLAATKGKAGFRSPSNPLTSLVAGEGFIAGVRPAFCSHLRLRRVRAVKPSAASWLSRFKSFPALSFEKRNRREFPLGDYSLGCGGRI
jgi:hypothetical protein